MKIKPTQFLTGYLAALLSVAILGCVHLPKFSVRSPDATGSTSGGAAQASPPVGNLDLVEVAAIADARAGLPLPALTKLQAATVSKVLALPATEPAAATVAAPAIGKTTSAVQKTVNTMSGLLCFCALLGVAFGAFLIYSGHYVSGLQFILGSFGVAIFAVWFALHWLIVSSCVLIGSGVFFLCTHYAIVKPLLVQVETTGGPILAHLEAAAKRAETWLEKEAKKL
jgi:hypothetical protein